MALPVTTTRRAWLSGAAFFALSPRAALAQGAPSRIGWLKVQDRDHTPDQLREFLAGLRSARLIEGRDFAMEYRFADGDTSRLTALARELVAAGVSMIVATSQPSADAARETTRTVPILARMIDDPVSSGAAQSLSHLGGNYSGVYTLLDEMSAKRLALLKQTAPSLRKVGVLLSLERGSTAHWLAVSERAARDLGLTLYPMDLRSADELDALFAAAADAQVNGLIVLRNPIAVTHDRAVIDLANRYRLPAVFDASEFVEAGGLMSYGPNLGKLYRLLAGYAERILKGAGPGDLPIEQPTQFDLVLNLKTAAALNIVIPDSVIASAARVIE